jgi:hypothetical protein
MLKIKVNNNVVKRIDPLVRWDAMGYDVLDRGFGVNRATAGVNFVLNTGAVSSILKVNYEQYFNSTMDNCSYCIWVMVHPTYHTANNHQCCIL